MVVLDESFIFIRSSILLKCRVAMLVEGVEKSLLDAAAEAT